mgnify:CR=1 FL=1
MSGGVFCIENWSGRIDSSDTVAPLLQFLKLSDAARVVHQRVETPRELGHYLSRFADLASYQVAYLALHGGPGHVWVSSDKVKLSTLAAWSRVDGVAPKFDPRTGEPTSWTLDLTGKVLYLGSCSTLRRQSRHLQDLRALTGATAICGYTRDVDWYEAAGFEVMLLSVLAEAASAKPNTVRKTLQRLWRRSGTLMDTLGFVSEPPCDPR